MPIWQGLCESLGDDVIAVPVILDEQKFMIILLYGRLLRNI